MCLAFADGSPVIWQGWRCLGEAQYEVNRTNRGAQHVSSPGGNGSKRALPELFYRRYDE
jgi:hypothetical protein